MKTNVLLYPRHCAILAMLFLELLPLPAVFAQGMPFSYQGQLKSGTNAANGSFDFTFTLWSSPAGPGQIGYTSTNLAVPVNNGLFVVTLDFGANAFDGAARWLQISVRSNSTPTFSGLGPRTRIAAAPYAIRALAEDSRYVLKSGDTIAGTLAVNGSLLFPSTSEPMMFINADGTVNPLKPIIVHSPDFPGYGLFYQDEGDRFIMQSSPTDPTPSLVVDLDSNWVTIANPAPKPGYQLSVNGRIVCEELLIQDSSEWPDYVFDDNYRLLPLDELDAHLKKNRHLPGIPSADEIEKQGIHIGDMQKRTVQKIEELTLYILEQNAKLAAQNARIQELEGIKDRTDKLAAENSELKERMSQLEKLLTTRLAEFRD